MSVTGLMKTRLIKEGAKAKGTTGRSQIELRSWSGFVMPVIQHWLTWFGLPLVLFVLSVPPLPVFGESYPAVHAILEICAVVVACLVFVVAWNMFPRNTRIIPLLVGCGFLAVALLDISHLLSYSGMPDWITPNDNNDKPIALWLAGRQLAALLLLGLVVLPDRIGSWAWRPWSLGVTLIAACLLDIAVVFGIRSHPGLFFGSSGLTPLKLGTEYLIVLTCLAAFVALIRQQQPAGKPYDARYLAAALLSTMASEMLFTLYRGPTDVYNFAGHVFKVVAYYQLYQALFIGMVREPFLRLEEAEAAHRISEGNFMALFEVSNDGLLLVDETGHVVLANSKAEALFGCKAGLLAGLEQAVLLPDISRGAQGYVAKDFSVGALSGSPQPTERRPVFRPDGTKFQAEVGVSSVFLDRVPHCLISLRNIDTQENLEKQLELQGQRLSYFFDHAVDWAWEIDASGLYTYSSAGVFALLGYQPTEVVGRSPLDFMPPEEAERVAPIWHELFSRRLPVVSLENINCHRNGQLLTLETSGGPFFDASGAFLGYRGIDRNITQHTEISRALKQYEQRFRLAFHHSPFGMCVISPQGRILYVNNALTRMLGYSENEFTHWQIRGLAHPDDYMASLPWRQALLAGRVMVANFESRYRHKNGRYIWLQVSISKTAWEGSEDGYQLAHVRDISDELEVRKSNIRQREIIERTEMAIGTVSREGTFTYLNPMARRLLDISPEADVSVLRLADFYAPAVVAQLVERAIPQAERTGIWEGEMLWRSREGHDISVWQVVIAHRDSDGKVAYWSVIARDLRDIRLCEARMEFQETHDVLTALPNRYLVRDRLQQSIAGARASERQVAVMMVDVDHFKRVNDSLGHSVGDSLLMEVAQRLRLPLRESDTLARQGGDEFIILLPEIRLVQDVVMIAEKLNACFDKPVKVGEHDIFVTASVGISVFPFDHDHADELLRKAEVAMYQAKEMGRNTYQFYTSDMDRQYREDMAMEADLRLAIEHDELFLHYQPKFDLGDGSLVGFEALLRWNHPKNGMIPPGRFIPVAERSNLIVALGEWALSTACRQMMVWQRDGLAPGKVAVNVSALQFEHGDLAGMVRHILAESGLAASCLELEITESILMRDPIVASHVLEEIKMLNVSIAIDDFGTGYSSLSYLRRFPVDVLKIDRSFVQEIGTNEDDAAIVHAIVSMAHALDIQVVAEGIETVEQQDFLRACNCDLAQGFLFGRPMTLEAAGKLLRR